MVQIHCAVLQKQNTQMEFNVKSLLFSEFVTVVYGWKLWPVHVPVKLTKSYEGIVSTTEVVYRRCLNAGSSAFLAESAGACILMQEIPGDERSYIWGDCIAGSGASMAPVGGGIGLIRAGGHELFGCAVKCCCPDELLLRINPYENGVEFDTVTAMSRKVGMPPGLFVAFNDNGPSE